MQKKEAVGSQKPVLTSRQQLIATCAAFFILGTVFATWASRIPAIRDVVMLTPVTLGYVLLGKGIGTIVIMPVVTAMIHRFGAKKTALIFGFAVILTLIPMTVAPNWEVLALVLFVTGTAFSGYNISINALGSKIEEVTGKSHMSTIHSWFGVGNLFGALVGIGMGALQISVFYHFWGIAISLIILLIYIYNYLPEDVQNKEREESFLKIPHGALIWLGLIAFLAASIEESISNWVALFFTDYVGTTGGVASIGYVAYAGSVLIMRLIGDRLKPRFGAQRLLSVGSLVASFGILVAIVSSTPVLASIGFVATGAGVALTFPMIFSAAGKEGAVALASVATIGYLGGMVSQPVMGFLVDHLKLSGGFIFIILCMLTISITSWKASLLKK